METPIPNQDTAKNLETHVNESIDNSDQTENKPTNGSVDEKPQKLKPNGNRYERRVYKVTDKHTSPK